MNLITEIVIYLRARQRPRASGYRVQGHPAKVLEFTSWTLRGLRWIESPQGKIRMNTQWLVADDAENLIKQNQKKYLVA